MYCIYITLCLHLKISIALVRICPKWVVVWLCATSSCSPSTTAAYQSRQKRAGQKQIKSSNIHQTCMGQHLKQDKERDLKICNYIKKCKPREEETMIIRRSTNQRCWTAAAECVHDRRSTSFCSWRNHFQRRRQCKGRARRTPPC